MQYGFCKHKHIAIKGLPFYCNDCLLEEERAKVLRLLKIFSVTAPKESYAGTFTPEQFMKVLESPEV